MLSRKDYDVTVVREQLPEVVRATLVAVDWDAQAVQNIIGVIHESPQYQSKWVSLFSVVRKRWGAIWDGSERSKFWPFIISTTSTLYSALVLGVVWARAVSFRAKHAERLFAYLADGKH